MSGEAQINGAVESGFETVREVFAAGFARDDAAREVGAAIAGFHRGRCVVDLWGGLADPATRKAWERETLVNVWSTTKGVCAIAIATLVDRGVVAYDTDVASIWPEFAQAGKERTTLAHLLSHQAGLPGFAAPTALADQCDWAGCCAKLAAQAPAWPPGTATSYHAVTYGWLVGEVIRRLTGMSVGTFLAREIAGPLKADVFVGLPAELEPRVARILGPRAPAAGGEISEPALMALINPVQDAEAPNDRAWRAAEIPAVNGQASAMGLARLYAPLARRGRFEGRQCLSDSVIQAMSAPATTDRRTDMLMGLVDSWGMGFMLNPLNAYGPGRRAFGHSGWGGTFGCADPDLELATGYVCNQMGSEMLFDPRALALAGAISQCAAAIP